MSPERLRRLPKDLTNLVIGEKSTKIGEGTFANVYKGDVVALPPSPPANGSHGFPGSEKATGRKGGFEGPLQEPEGTIQWPLRRLRLER